MSSAATTAAESPKPARVPKTNRLGFEEARYKGGKTTLCKGCGHDSITSSIVNALWEMGVDPTQVAKLSGIGCSSKTTAYFLGQSHGFNTVHGRMAAIATGVALANRNLVNIGVSGDGDTASIGLGNFLHMIRRNVPLIYIVEDNGCYGLTKGQFSATADQGSKLRTGETTLQPPIDLCALAIELGCGYVARSYSGDFKQVRALLKGAVAHNGTAVIDIISPCITFNDHEGSTKSFQFAKAHKDPLHEIEFHPFFQQEEIDYDAGETKNVEMPDGSTITLKKLDHDYDPSDRTKALSMLDMDKPVPNFHTGLIYYRKDDLSMQDQIEMVDEPLSTLPESKICPSAEVFSEIMETFK